MLRLPGWLKRKHRAYVIDEESRSSRIESVRAVPTGARKYYLTENGRTTEVYLLARLRDGTLVQLDVPYGSRRCLEGKE